MVDFTNLNSLAASILVETWSKLGLAQAVLCPGSRSSPLTVALARQADIDCVVSLDERSAAFFALGYAKRTRQPVALVCTSGTAAANFFPAIIEAYYSQVPLLVLTGDRPPMLRNCHAGQTIDQTKLYGDYPQWQTELALPEPRLDYCHYLRQTALFAWQRCLWPRLGVAHLNCPFAEPLAPSPDNTVEHLKSQLDSQQFYQHLNHFGDQNIIQNAIITGNLTPLLVDFAKPGLIVVGVVPGGETPEFLTAILAIAKQLNWPILCDALSNLRNYQDGEAVIITYYDFILRCPTWAQALIPEQVLQIGELPTSKELRSWLNQINIVRYCVGFNGENLDPLHGQTISLTDTVFDLLSRLQYSQFQPHLQQSNYTQRWQIRQQQASN
ncbi:MAG: 2-succinyl-5-enolpyruvyl-6-hydroxy-3-cyclohexene-1-carboxylic-acid synthase, partial [Synechocystis sp.]